jgi:hypothetical protein
MSNTIELLETIGRDASLRHASPENLSQALDEMDANAGLKMAAASGDRDHLAQELGGNDHKVVHIPTQAQGGCDPGDDDMEDEPDQNGDEKNGSHS